MFVFCYITCKTHFYDLKLRIRMEWTELHGLRREGRLQQRPMRQRAVRMQVLRRVLWVVLRNSGLQGRMRSEKCKSTFKRHGQ